MNRIKAQKILDIRNKQKITIFQINRNKYPKKQISKLIKNERLRKNKYLN